MTIAGRRALSAVAVLAALAALALAARPAAAAPIGSDGVVHACYKAKGKPKGALRVVKPGKRCRTRKGEKAIAWTVFGTPGAGSPGGTGSDGDAGTDAASKQDVLTLLGLIQQQSAVIDQLSSALDGLGLDVDSLTGQLGSLTGQLGSLTSDVNGLENVLGGVCAQLSDVTDQADALRAGLSVISNLLDPLTLGVLPSLPGALGAFNCP